MACVASNAGPQPKENQIVSEPAATVVLETPCPKCGRVMQLFLPPGLAAEDGRRLAGLVLCDLCMDNYPKQPRAEARAVRLPYADD